VEVGLVRTRTGADLTISDDGVGFDAAEQKLSRGGLGLISIHERVRLAGGTVDISSSPGRGTKVKVAVPFDHVHTRTSAFQTSRVASR
jgi:signal transduction histidine kinase